MTDEQKSKCHKIIHTAAVSAGAIGAGLAPIPGSATVPITGIQIGMIVSLGAVFGLDITKSAAASILGGAAASIGGQTVSQFLVGWIPFLGSVINATTAVSITEGLGWLVAEKFSEETKTETDSATKTQTDSETKIQTDSETKIQTQKDQSKETNTVAYQPTKEETHDVRAEEKNRNLTDNERFRLFWLLALAVVILGTISNVILMHYPFKWQFTSGTLIVLTADILAYIMYGERLCVKRKTKDGEFWLNESGRVISTSNFLSLVITIIISSLYLAHNEEVARLVADILRGMNFDNGKFILDLTTILQYIPVLNVGLALIVVGWILYGVLVKVSSNS